jgi:hypothetical protein
MRHFSFLLLLILACGGPDDAPGNDTPALPAAATTGTELDVCALLTAEEIQEATGIAPGQPNPVPPQCTWPTADGRTETFVQLLVTASDIDSFDELMSTLRAGMGADFNPASYERVEGVGDFAVIVDGFMMQSYVPGRMVQLTVSPPGERFAAAPTRALLEKTIQRVRTQ